MLNDASQDSHLITFGGVDYHKKDSRNMKTLASKLILSFTVDDIRTEYPTKEQCKLFFGMIRQEALQLNFIYDSINIIQKQNPSKATLIRGRFNQFLSNNQHTSIE